MIVLNFTVEVVDDFHPETGDYYARPAAVLKVNGQSLLASEPGEYIEGDYLAEEWAIEKLRSLLVAHKETRAEKLEETVTHMFFDDPHKETT